MTIDRPPPTLADADAGFLDLCASFATTFAHADASPSVRGGDASADDAMIWQVAPAMPPDDSQRQWRRRAMQKCSGKVRRWRQELTSVSDRHALQNFALLPFQEMSEFLKICSHDFRSLRSIGAVAHRADGGAA